MIINRYLIREIVSPLLVMLAVLVTIFAGYSTSRYLADATHGLMGLDTVMLIVLLKITIALEILLPTSLYLSVIVGLGRLYKDEEMTALFASGVGPGRVLAVVFLLSIPVALLAASLSLVVRPWAYEKTFWLKAKAEAEFDVTRLKERRFYELGNGEQVIFVEHIDQHRKIAQGIFVQKDLKGPDDVLEVMSAQHAVQLLDQSTGRQVLQFQNGCSYEFSRTGTWRGKAMESGSYTVSLWPKEITPPEYKIKAASTPYLARSSSLADIAELQWRFSTPLATILLALVGIPFSRTTSREGKYARVTVAVFLYAIYYSISTLAKIWVENGTVSPFPGIWWVQVLLAGVVVLLFCHRSWQFWSPRGRG